MTSTRTRVFRAPTPLRFWHLASLDAPSVALAWSLGFAWAARVRLPLWVSALLVLAVWTVYVADRLLDAHNGLLTGQLQSLRERHLFHWRHRRAFLPLAVLAAVAAAFLVIALMPTGARERNSVLAAASLVYFTRVHAGRGLRSTFLRGLWAPFPKELLVGLLFTAGCVIPAWSRSAFPVPALLAPAVFFAILAWLNCHAIDRWEADTNNTAPQRIALTACLVAVAGLLAAALLLHAQPRSAALLVAGAIAALLLALLDAVRDRLAPVALRAAADLALLTPALLTPLLLVPASRLLQ